MSKILLIDDDAALTNMLTEFLEGEGFETVASFNGTDGAIAATDPSVDAVILDMMMPDISGIEALQRIRASSSVPVIMLTARGSEDDRAAGLEFGADDYIAKPYYARELLARIKAVLRRQGASALARPQRLVMGGLCMIPSERQVTFAAKPIELTTTQFGMLELLLRSAFALVTKDELSATVLRRKRQPYDRSIDVHMSNLRKKLGTISASAIEIETVRAIGYRLKVKT